MENIGYPDTKNKKQASPLKSFLDEMIPETYHTSYEGDDWDLGKASDSGGDTGGGGEAASTAGAIMGGA